MRIRAAALKKIKEVMISATICGAVCLLGGCTFFADSENSNQELTMIAPQEIALSPDIYDSEDTAMLVQKDTTNKTLQLQNVQTGKRYTLNYDGTTSVWDKYDQALSMAQIKPGSILQVRFYMQTKHASYVKEATDCVRYDHVDNYILDAQKGTITIADTVYKFSSHTAFLSGEKEIELEDIVTTDVLSVWGYQDKIYGVYVDKGHGYLRLENEDYFVGGWIEVGQSTICRITENMLLTVPEGVTTVRISQSGTNATQEINFVRDEEMVWDLQSVEIVMPKTGNIIFTVTPSDAQLTIDGENVDASEPITLEYGIHQMTVRADGYDTLSKYIKVASESANINVELEKKQEEEKEEDKSDDEETDADEEKTGKTETKNTETKTVSTSTAAYQVHIDSPQGVEVYLDGNYLGIAPVEFGKDPGNYVVTLRKTGYQARSYTLQIDGEEKDVNYSFSELVKLSD